jgi:hypothetical protein
LLLAEVQARNVMAAVVVLVAILTKQILLLSLALLTVSQWVAVAVALVVMAVMELTLHFHQ